MLCAGTIASVSNWQVPALAIKCTGHGAYQRTRLIALGFPRGDLMRSKQVKGIQIGDQAHAEVSTGKKAGTHFGRVAVRATGSFNIQTSAGVIQGVPHPLLQDPAVRRRIRLFTHSALYKGERIQGRRYASSAIPPGLNAEVSRADG